MNKKNGLSRYRQKKLVLLFCADLTATQAAQVGAFNRNTVNRYDRIFREAIRDHQRALKDRFTGTVEVDESYFGATRRRGDPGSKRRGRGSEKQPVFGVIEPDGRVFTEVVPDCKKKTLQSLIRGKAALESIIMSDGWAGYDGLVDVGYDAHFRIRKAKRAARDRPASVDGNVHINGIESFWSFAKRRLAKFNGTRANFELHLKECEWRWRKDHDTLVQELTRLLGSKLNQTVEGCPFL
jgi:transposase-like protein